MNKQIRAILPLAVVLLLLPASQILAEMRLAVPETEERHDNQTEEQAGVFDRLTYYGSGFVEYEWTIEPHITDYSGTVIPHNAKQAAKLFLLRNAESLLVPIIQDFDVVGYETNGDGAIEVIFEQSYLDRPIITSELRIHVLDRQVIFVEGKIISDLDKLDPGSDIDGTQLPDFIAQKYPNGMNEATSNQRLVYYPGAEQMLLGFEYSEDPEDGHFVEIFDTDGVVLFRAMTYDSP